MEGIYKIFQLARDWAGINRVVEHPERSTLSYYHDFAASSSAAAIAAPALTTANEIIAVRLRLVAFEIHAGANAGTFQFADGTPGTNFVSPLYDLASNSSVNRGRNELGTGGIVFSTAIWGKPSVNLISVLCIVKIEFDLADE